MVEIAETILGRNQIQDNYPGFMVVEKETKRVLVGLIQDYLLDEKDLELGDLAAGILIDQILKAATPMIYNQGVADAIKVLNRFGAQMEEELEYLRIA